MTFTKPILAVMVVALSLSGCATDEAGNPRPLTRAEKGAIIGAVGGAAVAAHSTKDGNKRGKRVLLGAVGGGLAGAAVGNYMDQQRKDFQQQLAPEVQNGSIAIEKLPGNNLRVTMTSQTAFDTNSTEIKAGFKPSLTKISKILVKYGKTQLTVIGHTDNVGTNDYNQSLSERRAQSVNGYLQGKGVIAERVDSVGRGEEAPRATNANENGRRLNRRVEILIEPIVEDAAG
jgi:outer membrane protein OmpA-like peptidoglycan-associated protein